MKPLDIKSSIGLDRLATRKEVRCAFSLSSQGSFEIASGCDDLHRMDSDCGDRAYSRFEDSMWLAIVCEMPDSTIN